MASTPASGSAVRSQTGRVFARGPEGCRSRPRSATSERQETAAWRREWRGGVGHDGVNRLGRPPRARHCHGSTVAGLSPSVTSSSSPSCQGIALAIRCNHTRPSKRLNSAAAYASADPAAFSTGRGYPSPLPAAWLTATRSRVGPPKRAPRRRCGPAKVNLMRLQAGDLDAERPWFPGR